MDHTSQARIAVVTDSTAYIPQDLVEKYGIHVVPLCLIMGDKTWMDGVDIEPPAFYKLLETSSSFPTTSQPTVAAFQDLFVKLSKEVEGIVAILISDGLSGTLDSARAAQANLPDIAIEIIDSKAASMMLGFPVLAAARAAEAGESLQAVADAGRELVGKTRIMFVVATLEYLHRGGRIGGAAKLLGSALQLKPILEISGGMVRPMTKVRTRRKALEKVHELLAEQVKAGDRVHMAVINVAAGEDAARFKDELEARYRPVELMVSECSPAIGAHVGPGTVGVAYYVE